MGKPNPNCKMCKGSGLVGTFGCPCTLDNLSSFKFKINMFKKIKFFVFLTVLSTLLSSCASRVSPNEWLVYTNNCWNTIQLSKAGDIVPRLVSSCDRSILLPATEMSADFSVDTKFKGKVQGRVNLTYQWIIEDPVVFVQNAKSVLSTPTTDVKGVDVNVLETVENNVVDKYVIDIIREYTPEQEPGLDEKTLEVDVIALASEKMKQRGIRIMNPSCNIEFTAQTEEALDVISALKFYEANGEGELGREVIKAKASATKVIIEATPRSVTPE